MALTLDGHASAISSAYSVSATLTTTQTDNIVVAIVQVFLNSDIGISTVTGGGLTWGLRKNASLATSYGATIPLRCEVWWAYAPAALTAEPITVTFINIGEVVYSTINVFAIHGANLQFPFDTNTSLPAIDMHAGTGGTSSHSVTGISTTSADTFLFAAFAGVAAATGTADSTFSLLDSVTAGAYGSLASEYKILSSILSSTSQNVFTGFSASTDYVAYVDAIRAAGSTWAGPTYVNHGTGISNYGSPLVPSYPTSLVVGNLLLAHVSITSGSLAEITWPSGWTLIDTWFQGTQTGSHAYRYVDGTEGASITVTFLSGTGCMAHIDQYTNTKTSSPIGALSHASATTNPITASSITTTANNSLVVRYIDHSSVDPPDTPNTFTGRSAGAFNAAPRGAWSISDVPVATSGTVTPSDSVTELSISDWLDFLTEILAASAVPTPDTGTVAAIEANDTASFAGSVFTPGGPVSGSFTAVEASDVVDFAGYTDFVPQYEYVHEHVNFADTYTTRVGTVNVTLINRVRFPVGDEFFTAIVQRTNALTSGVGIHLAQTTQLQHAGATRDSIKIHHAQNSNSNYHLTLSTLIKVYDVLSRAFSVTLHPGNVGVHDLLKGMYALTMFVGLKLHDVLFGSAHYHQLMLQNIQLGSGPRRLSGAALGSTIAIHDVLSKVYVAKPTISERVSLHATAGRTLLVGFTMPEGVHFAVSGALNAVYHQTYPEGAVITAAYVSPGGGITTWAVNIRTGATTEYQNYNFNSFAKQGDRYLGASSTGLYELDGPNDAGAPIIADILGGFAQFGGSHYASIKQVYLGMRGSGQFVLKIIEGTGKTRVYGVNTKNMRTTRVNVGKGLRSRYFAYELVSTGQDFDLDSIELVPLIMQRRV